MRADPKIVPDFEMIICPPAESFRWNTHDYPFFGAKWHYRPEFELHLTRTTSGVMMVGDYVGEFDPDEHPRAHDHHGAVGKRDGHRHQLGPDGGASMLRLIPALNVLGVAQRHIVAGLTFGAVKDDPPLARRRSDGMKQLVDLEADDDEGQTIKPERRGFLPIHANAFDRGFIGVVLFIAIHLFWLRFVEQLLPLYVATALSLLLAVFIVRRG